MYVFALRELDTWGVMSGRARHHKYKTGGTRFIVPDKDYIPRVSSVMPDIFQCVAVSHDDVRCNGMQGCKPQGYAAR